MKVVILAGGLGTRLCEKTDTIPKPMVKIGQRPILWHIMSLFAAAGFCEFIIALGYKGNVIREYFVQHEASWKVHLVDTGLKTETGGRIKRLREWIGNEPFMMSYGDGLADIDIEDLVTFHKREGKLATVSAVRPPARFGALRLEGNSVTSFSEKNQADVGWINGGFFVLEPEVLKYISGDMTSFEKEPLERLAYHNELSAYKHRGFWAAMDTLREHRQLEKMYNSGSPPWVRGSCV